MTSTIPRRRKRYVRGLTLVLTATVAGVIALSVQSAEAAALPMSGSHSSAVALNANNHNSENSEDASGAKHNKKKHDKKKHDKKKHDKKKHDKKKKQHQQRKISSGAGQKQSGSDDHGAKAVQQATAQRAADVKQASAVEQAAAMQVAAIKQAAAAKQATARKAMEQARIKAAKASQKAVSTGAVPTVVLPILIMTPVDTGAPTQPTVVSPVRSAHAAVPAQPAGIAPPSKRPNTAATRPLPTQLVWIGHVAGGIQPILLAAFVLVFGFGLVLGGTTRRMERRPVRARSR